MVPKPITYIFSAILLFLATVATSQEIPLHLFEDMKARSIGPAGMSGRVTSIDVVLSEPDIIYIGTASGGLWKSESGGTRWAPIFDDQPIQNIGAVKIQQSNPDVIWVGTGEANPRNSQSSGAGLYKSVNGGKSWKLMGLENTVTIHRIIVHRDNPDIVWVAATGSAWGDNPERGVYKTVNGGKSWKKVLYINEKTGCADLIVDPTNPNKLFAAMWEYRREPWFFTSGGEGSGLYVSFDGGETWKKRTSEHGLPKGELGRMGLALCHSNPKVVYALVESKKLGLYRSDDGGFSWRLQSDKNVGNRPFYYADIYVDPQNENRIYNLWSYVSLSEDGGKTFKTILNYAKGVHPDHHAFWVHPDNPDYLIEGNDGGLNISRDRGKNWRFVENLPLAQFYHINYDLERPYNIYGGMQDNGSWVGPSYHWKVGGIRNYDFAELYFGDGFDVVPIPDDSRYGYAMSQGGNVALYDRQTGATHSVKPVHPENIPLRFNWNAAISIDPNNSNALYFGSQFVHYSEDRGQHWKLLSPDLTTNNPEKQKQAESGGLTIDATQAENHTTILCISPSKHNQNVLWVGTDDGNLQLTQDGGKNWTNLIGRLRGAPENAWIPQIHVSEHNAGEAFVVINNYRQNDWNTYVYHTMDFGKKWDRIADGSQVKGYALSIVQDPKVESLLFLGTENGLWISIDKGKNWTQWKHGYPSVSTMDLKIHPREADLIIGTFGRAAYIIDNIEPLRELAINNELISSTLHLFDIPESFMSQWKSAGGVRFTADANFKGENRPRGAMIDYWVNEPIKGKKLAVVILDENGDTMRDYKAGVDTGLNRIYWGFERNGVWMPSRGSKKPEMKRGGIRVKPGSYTIHLEYNGETASGNFKVNADPRTVFNEADYDARWALLQEHQKVIEMAAKGMQQISSAQKTVELVNQQMVNVDDSLQAKLKKEGKRITDSLNALSELYMTPRDFVGYDHVTVRLNGRLSATRGYISRSDGPPSQMAQLSYEQSKAETEKVIARINQFFAAEWQAYQELIDESMVSIFKEYKEIRIED